MEFVFSDINCELPSPMVDGRFMLCIFPHVSDKEFITFVHAAGCSRARSTTPNFDNVVVQMDTSTIPDASISDVGFLIRLYERDSQDKLRVYAEGTSRPNLQTKVQTVETSLSEPDYKSGFSFLREPREIGHVTLKVRFYPAGATFPPVDAVSEEFALHKATEEMHNKIIQKWDALCHFADLGGLFVLGGERNTIPAVGGIPAAEYFKYRQNASYAPLPKHGTIALLLAAQAISGLTDSQISDMCETNPYYIRNAIIMTACRLLPASFPYSSDVNVYGEASDRQTNLNTMRCALEGNATISGDCEDLTQTGIDVFFSIRRLVIDAECVSWISRVQTLALGLVVASVECAVDGDRAKRQHLDRETFNHLPYEGQQAEARSHGWGDSQTHNCAIVLETEVLQSMLSGGDTSAPARPNPGINLLEGTAFVTMGREGEPWVEDSAEIHEVVEAAICAGGGQRCTAPLVNTGDSFYRVVYAIVLPETTKTPGGRFYVNDASTGILGVPFKRLMDTPNLVSLHATAQSPSVEAATARRVCVMHHPRIPLKPVHPTRCPCASDLEGLFKSKNWGLIYGPEIPRGVKQVAATTTIEVADGVSIHFYHD